MDRGQIFLMGLTHFVKCYGSCNSTLQTIPGDHETLRQNVSIDILHEMQHCVEVQQTIM